MEQQDKLEIKELIKEVVEETRATIENQFNIIDFKLDSIQKQTERTNGRVTKLEDDVKQLAIADQRHYTVCPHNARIELLQEKVNSMMNRKKFIFTTVTLNTVILGIIGAIIALILNLKGR